MKIYVVGGAIRDELLGLPVRDKDYVVVGATPDAMIAKGFKPVGADFPVFLHPVTKEEYALARTERKSGHGYKGFVFHTSPDVTLEEDLARRDLTINAIARAEDGTLIDPFYGQRDLASKTLRHVSPAFAEDPVRVLRIARFAARFTMFHVAEETLTLMRQMVAQGEIDHLVPERVWQELSRGLLETQPSRLFLTLRECDALAHILPEVDDLFGVPQPPKHHPEVDTGDHVMRVVDQAAQAGLPLATRFAALTHDLGKGTTPPEEWPHHYGHEARSVQLVEDIAARLKIPSDCRDLAVLVARHHGEIHRARELRAGTIVQLLERCDALRRPERFEQILAACACDSRGRPGYENLAYPAADTLRTALEVIRSVDAAGIAQACSNPSHIPARIHEARVTAIKQTLHTES